MMKLRRILSIISALGVLLIISRGSSASVMAISSNAVRPTYTPVPTNNELVEQGSLLDELNSTLAPNQLWGVVQGNDTRTSEVIKIIRKSDLSILATMPVSPSLGQYLISKSWSPDSQKLVMQSYDDLYSHAPVKRLVILHFNYAGKELIPYIFQIPYPQNEDYLAAIVDWSMNSKKIAVNINERDIFILDVQGHVIRKLQPALPPSAAIQSLKWLSNNELRYTVAYSIKVN